MSCESFPVIVQSYHSVIGCQVPLSLDCIASHPKYAVSKPMNRIILNGKTKNHHIPITIQKSPNIQTINCGTRLNLFNRYVIGPNKRTLRKIIETIMAKLAINFHPHDYSSHRLRHHHLCMRNFFRHKASSLLRLLDPARLLLQHLQ